MAGESILDHLDSEAVVLFLGTHPDDEHTVGPLLARAADVCRKVVVLCLTGGESGWNLHREDLTRTLADVRRQEFHSAMAVLGCEPIMLDYVNGLTRAHPDGLAVLDYEETAVARWRSPGGRDASVDEVLARWSSQSGDPVQRVLEIFRREKPTVVINFDPLVGYTNHIEHMAAAKVALAAVKQYNSAGDARAALFYAHSPDQQVKGAERIKTADLSRAGGKDYRQIADVSQMFYESQYGSRGSDRAAKYMFAWHDEQLIEKAPLD